METLVTAAEAANIIRKTRGGWFGATFVKADGSERRLVGRTGAWRKTKGGRNNAEDHHEYVTVWSRFDNGFRNINLNTLQEVRFGGKRYRVVYPFVTTA